MINRKAYEFFRKNAGGIVGELAIYAAELARAEDWAQRSAMEFEWVADDNPDRSWESDVGYSGPGEYSACLLKRECPCCGRMETIESLWGIVHADNDYRRLVEAELALNATSVAS